MSAGEDWKDDEQQRLEEGLLKSVAIVDQGKKWKAIALVVGTRDAEACAARFQACRQLDRSSRAVERDEDTSAAASQGPADRNGWGEPGGWWNSRAGWGQSWSSGGSAGQQNWSSSSWEPSSKAEGGAVWEEEKSQDAPEPEPLDEGQQRALDMKREVEANRERMRQQQERRQQDDAKTQAKKAAEVEEINKKRREHAEAKDKEFKDANDRKAALREQERQRELEAKREAERTDIPFFGDKRSPAQPKRSNASAAPGGWAAKASAKTGHLQKQRKEEEMERRAAEVLANLPSLPKPKAKASKGDSSDEAEVPAAHASPAPAPPRAKIGPSSTRQPAASPETADLEVESGGTKGVGKKGKDGRSDTHSLVDDSGSVKGAGKSGKGGKSDNIESDNTKGAGKNGKIGPGKGAVRKPKKQTWWERIDSANICPISLVPICELPQAPFSLEAAGSEAIHYFDARFLANFLVSSCDFIDPINRRELTHEECSGLDDHLWRHHPENSTISVADAFALFEINGRGGAAAGDDRVQREATAVLQHLFRFQSSRRTDRSGRAINYAEGSLTVVDDDDVLTANPQSAPLAEAGPPTGTDFPDLLRGSAGPIRPGAPSSSWKGKPAGNDGCPAAEAFPDLPSSSAKPKVSASAKPKGPAPKASTKAAAAKKGGKQQHQSKAWGAAP